MLVVHIEKSMHPPKQSQTEHISTQLHRKNNDTVANGHQLMSRLRVISYLSAFVLAD